MAKFKATDGIRITDGTKGQPVELVGARGTVIEVSDRTQGEKLMSGALQEVQVYKVEIDGQGVVELRESWLWSPSQN